MNRNLVVLVFSTAALAAGASAGEIYKYVDDEGNVHYVDRPSGEAGEERLNVTYARTNNAAISAQVERRREYMDALEEAREESTSRREAEEKARAELEARAKQCEQHRKRLETYLRSRRLYRENEAGEREYLDEAQMQEARHKVEEKIEEYCS